MADFDDSKRETLKMKLKVELECFEPECFMRLLVSAGSVRVGALLTIPDAAVGPNAASGDSASVVESVTAAAQSFIMQSATQLSSLGVEVEAVETSVTVQSGVTMAIVVAPPPPTPPLPEVPPLLPPTPNPSPIEAHNSSHMGQ